MKCRLHEMVRSFVPHVIERAVFFSSAHSTLRDTQSFVANSAERMILTISVQQQEELLTASGERPESSVIRSFGSSVANDVANVFDASWPAVYLLYIPQSLAVRERAAAGLGNDALAAFYRNRLAALRGG
jgi:hypothetical protein